MKYLFIIFLFCVEAKRKRILISDDPVEQIGSLFYKKDVLTDKFQDPKELSYDSTTRNLYFMYMDDELANSGRGFVNIITKEARKINGIVKNKAVAVDTETSEVYFGSEDGLYKFEPMFNNATHIGLFNVNIMKLVIKNNAMFVLNGENHQIYKVFDDGRKIIKVGDWETVLEFEVDEKRNIHFVTLDGVYCAIEGHETIKNTVLNEVYHFLVDPKKTFGITLNSLYIIHCNNGTATKVADLDFFPRSITFGDYGDIFYTIDNDNNIYRLKPINSYVLYNIKLNSRK